MPTAHNPRITLELTAGADPIRGSIEHPDGRRQPFWGWLELMEQLTRVAADEPRRRSRPKRANTGTPPRPDTTANRPQPHPPTREEP